jgi:uncharacterized secreted protein with C-terminal beta-propeller domain
MRVHAVTRAAVAALALAACRGGVDTPRVTIRSAALTPIQGCDGAIAALRERAIADMNRRVDANLEIALTGGCYAYPVAGGGLPAAPTASAPAQTSGTNDQVAGVDEPDLVKTDGTHLYLVADGRLQVLSSWPAAETSRLATLTLPGTPKRLFVAGDRAVVFSSMGTGSDGGITPGIGAPVPIGWTGRECTYGYDCVPQGDGTPLLASVVDLSDPASPRVVRALQLSSSYLSARLIDDTVHVVVTAPAPAIGGLDFGEGLACSATGSADSIRSAFEDLRARNRAIIEGADLSASLPSGTDISYAGGTPTERPLFEGCGGFWAAPDADGTWFLSVASFAVHDGAPVGLTTTLGHPGVVFASSGSLYVAAPQTWYGGPWFWAAPVTREQATTIHQFRLRGAPAAGADYLGSGAVEGRVLNQFALDEHDGRLRVATTIGHLPDPATRSAVTVLRTTDTGLEETGRVDGIAPGEDIRAVRFDGDRGFVVTFRKTDPLFVLDLSDPAAPRVRGELVVPGFATYLHLVDPGHLLSIGFDAETFDTWSLYSGIRLQVIDVSDASVPALVDAEVIGTRGTGSQAASDHLAFNWFAPKALLGVPITVCESTDGTYATQVTFNGLLVYAVSMETGFTSLGGVSHPVASTDPYASPCYGGWTSSTSLVKRSVFLDDFVFSITSDEVRVQDTRALGTDLARVDLLAP